MNLGPTVKFLRTSAGYKQKQLAAELGVSENYISLIERGAREPSLDFLKGMASFFDVPVWAFFVGSMQRTGMSNAKSELELLELRLSEFLLELVAIRKKGTVLNGEEKKPPGIS